jgi:YfdX protein
VRALEKSAPPPTLSLQTPRGCGVVSTYLKKGGNMSFLYKAMLACLFGSLVILPTAALATNSAAAKPDQQTQSQTEDKRKTLMADATSAIQETQTALKHLDDGDTKQALAALERATGKLDVILARDPILALAPAGVGVVTYDMQGGLDAVNKVRMQVENFMNAGQLQEARRLLKNLASETVISVTNIPLATYPDAIKSAVKFIDQNKKDEAKRVLQTALNTQVVTDTIIPLPVVKAQEALKNAEGLAEKKDRTKDDNVRLQASMDQARGQLDFAQALGYGTKKDFDKMYAQLTEIRDKTADNKFGTGWFAKIKASIADFLKSRQPKNG